MHYTIIPKGYRLTLESWENDGDNPRTEVLVGLDDLEIKFYVKLAKLHSARSNGKGCFGDMYDPSRGHTEPYLAALDELGVEYEAVINKLCGSVGVVDCQDSLRSIAYDIGLSSEEFYTRVLESFSVEYIPEDIQIQDVTVDFI